MLIGEIGLNLSFNVLIQSGFQDYTKIMLVCGCRTLYCIVICEPFPLFPTTDALCTGVIYICSHREYSHTRP